MSIIDLPPKINSVNCLCVDHLYTNHLYIDHWSAPRINSVNKLCIDCLYVDHLYIDYLSAPSPGSTVSIASASTASTSIIDPVP